MVGAGVETGFFEKTRVGTDDGRESRSFLTSSEQVRGLQQGISSSAASVL
jgi:hypothetical protein